jgi:hypothetical protein
MFTACQARLLCTFSGIRTELLSYSQAGDSDFSTWALKLQHTLQAHPNTYNEVSHILDRSINEQDFLTKESLNSVSTLRIVL